MLLAWIGGVGWLGADVEEADSVLELCFDVDGLAFYGGERLVVGV